MVSAVKLLQQRMSQAKPWLVSIASVKPSMYDIDVNRLFQEKINRNELQGNIVIGNAISAALSRQPLR